MMQKEHGVKPLIHYYGFGGTAAILLGLARDVTLNSDNSNDNTVVKIDASYSEDTHPIPGKIVGETTATSGYTWDKPPPRPQIPKADIDMDKKEQR
jgi:hypothetical protein